MSTTTSRSTPLATVVSVNTAMTPAQDEAGRFLSRNMKNNASLRVRELQRSQTSITPSLGSEPLGSTGPTRNPATLRTDNRVVRASSQTPSTPCSEDCWMGIPTVSTNPVDR
ncbi:hypothetical protein AYX14_03110 [Cryptococcus neoformans]|nr:hypothetical protein AYX15_02375 [Cryptococcus neoformans var. grubii]OWZ71438.1 hypothetical protein AYX14_03110 [Cryptococcus neoformans var. grubii]